MEGQPIDMSGFDTLADFGDRQICKEVDKWSHAHHESPHGVSITWHWIWARDPEGGVTWAFRLVCGGEVDVHGLTSGPGAHGESVPCPGHTEAWPSTAYWWVDDRHRGYSQNHGGLGHHDNGFWHYRFYNPQAGNVRAQLSGMCI